MSAVPQTLERIFGVPFSPQATLTELRQYHHPNTYCCNAQGELIGIFSNEHDCTSITIPADWQALEYLNLSDNKHLQSLTFAAALPRLQHLDVSDCELSELMLPAGFDALRWLDVSRNELPSVVLEGAFPALEYLDLSGNALKALDLGEGYPKLTYLYLNDNGLEIFTHADRLPSLEILHLGENKLNYAPQDLILSDHLQTLYLVGNAPKNIPKVFLGDYSENCVETARIWFEELRDYPHEANKAVKLMLTGNGNAGKSTLLYALKNGSCPHECDTTHGVEMETLELRDITYNIWDFGGQEVYHGTHRLFMASEAIQVILFDPITEESARKYEKVKDRVSDDKIFNHPIEYWYETTKELSPDSQYFIVQNKKDLALQEDVTTRQYADGKAKFLHVSAKTGAEIDDLMYFLHKQARNLPDFEMLMPQSWLRVRQFFIDNLQRVESRKIITKDDFAQLCNQHKVNPNEAVRSLLFKYLHHSGFLYYHENLGEKIIADQRWALEAIYMPLNRKAPHYEEFRHYWKGKIWVNRLFQVFGDQYSDEEKQLFLSFMKSCGLCFQINNREETAERESSIARDVYVFPEFLPAEKPDFLIHDWQSRARDVRILRLQLPWLNYFLIQSFISALGQKTNTENIWRNGIHVSTPEGWFKVELDYDQKSILLHIEQNATGRWLEAILEELKVDRDTVQWEISMDSGTNFVPFDLESWKQQRKEAPGQLADALETAHSSEPLPKRLPDVMQKDERQIILFLAANPTVKKLSLRNEHSHITEKLTEKSIQDKFMLIPKFGISPDRMNEAISDYRPTIVHFGGHGDEQNPDTRQGGGLIFHSDDFQGQKEVDADQLGKIFRRIKKNHPQLKVVLLNACYSEPQAKAISETDIYAIGVSDQLASLAARLFAAGFYRQYAMTNDIEKAVDFGLTQALTEDGNIENLVYLFYQGKRISI